MQTYRLAEKREMREIATLFTESFMDYPLFQMILSKGEAYKTELFRLNYINTKSYVQQDGCFVGILDGKIVSAVLLKKSGDPGPGFMQYLLNGGLALAARVGVKRITHILSTLEKMKEACSRYGKKTWYVDSFAVAKGYQGKSLGSALFRSFIFPHVRKQGGGMITLVTHTELNKKFYCKNGFEVFSEFGIGPEGGRIPNYSFRQEIGK